MESITIKLSRGVLKDPPEESLPEGYASDGRHVRFDDGTCFKMPGYASYFATAASTFVNGLFAFNNDSGTAYVVRCTKDNVYSITAGTPTDTSATCTGTALQRWSICAFGNVIILDNGKDAMQQLKPTYGTAAVVAGSPPVSGVVRTFQRHLFALAQATVPRQVSWSDVDDYETWTPAAANEAGSIILYESSTPVIGGDGLGDFFAVYTKDQIHVFQYIGGEYIFSRRIAEWNNGLMDKSLLVSVNNAHFYMTPKAGFYGFDGGVATPIGVGVWKDVYANLSTSYLAQSFAFPYKEKGEVWFCVPTGSATLPTLACIYNYRNGSWSFDDLDATNETGWYAGCDAEPLTYPLISPVDKKLYSLGSGADKALGAGTVGYPGYVISPEYDFGDPEAYKTVYKIQPVIESTAAAVYLYIGYRLTENASVTWSSAYTITPGTTLKLDTRITSRRFRFKVYTTAAGTPWTLCRLKVFYKTEGTR